MGELRRRLLDGLQTVFAWVVPDNGPMSVRWGNDDVMHYFIAACKIVVR
jgi:hypothetical protein